jgi:hypothetical protein
MMAEQYLFAHRGQGSAKMRFRATEVVSLLVAVIALVGTLANSFYAYSNRNRELDIELVKLGVAILRADPQETQTRGAREWAINVIETFSRVPFTAKARAELLSNKLLFEMWWNDIPLSPPGTWEAWKACTARHNSSENCAAILFPDLAKPKQQ